MIQFTMIRTPMIRFTKIRLFLLLALLFAMPFVASKGWWLLHSRHTAGVYSFRGMGEAGDQIQLDYSVCWFPLGRDTIWFNGTGNLPFHEGDAIPVRYQVADPGDAKIDVFPAIWGDTVVYAGIPLFILLMIYVHPRVVPRGRKVRVVMRRPFLLLD
ncbi:hypothetical protein [Puia sp.]|jgi:hypothetical protein|uniref:hypothetical protein n=1 Tax=Puia sp. TaxID=2045100 RepID=UPI002F3FD53C